MPGDPDFKQKCVAAATAAKLRFARSVSKLQQWGEQDSNLRRRKPTDLQSVPFGHFGIPPYQPLANGSPRQPSNCSEAICLPIPTRNRLRAFSRLFSSRLFSRRQPPQAQRLKRPKTTRNTSQTPRSGNCPEGEKPPEKTTPRREKAFSATRFEPLTSRASGGTRTHDQRFTKPLLYQLSYAGGGMGKRKSITKSAHPAIRNDSFPALQVH